MNGKFSDDWGLTASADTRDDDLSSDLFSNFLSKSPDSLFRRIDPDYHYPTFGDDGTVEEMAPDARQVLREGRARRRATACGATSRSATWTTSSRRSTAGSTVRTCTTSRAGDDELRRAALRRRRLRRRARHDLEPRGVPRHRRLAVLPASSGHPDGLGARADRDARQGVGPRHGRRQPARRDRLRHRLPAGSRRAVRAARRRPRATTCSFAAACSAATRRTSSCATSTRRASIELDALSVGAAGHYWFNEHVKVGLTANNNDRGRHRQQPRWGRHHRADELRIVVQAAGRAQAKGSSRSTYRSTTAASASPATTTRFSKASRRRAATAPT